MRPIKAKWEDRFMCWFNLNHPLDTSVTLRWQIIVYLMPKINMRRIKSSTFFNFQNISDLNPKSVTFIVSLSLWYVILTNLIPQVKPGSSLKRAWVTIGISLSFLNYNVVFNPFPRSFKHCVVTRPQLTPTGKNNSKQHETNKSHPTVNPTISIHSLKNVLF